ncbi:uncharacterized protein [Dermacentor andersoni]|uniref:uncharacterized protein isoform X1 n=1 Tax=Dermacentor andersoni TaxID=34620 RepID=UPI003B3AD092
MTADANVVGEEELGATWRYLAKSDLGTLENAPYGVRVNLIRSGYMKTTMIKPPTVSVEEHMEVLSCYGGPPPDVWAFRNGPFSLTEPIPRHSTSDGRHVRDSFCDGEKDQCLACTGTNGHTGRSGSMHRLPCIR